jgi:predicted ABC-type ATPase
MPERSRRLRILAGPNGSGKSTIVKKIKNNYYCGFFVNADEIQQILDTKRVLNLNSEYGLDASLEVFNQYLLQEGKSWLDKAQSEKLSINITFSDNNILIGNDQPTGKYDAAIAADFIRFQLLSQNNTFTFETVLSHPSKLDFLQQAKELGYKNYLYFICTVDPEININRVAQRVALKGHSVPKNKIITRYYSSLALLPFLVPQTYRTFLFDNSTENSEIKLVAEVEKGDTFIPKTEEMPWWVYEYVIDPLFIGERDS